MDVTVPQFLQSTLGSSPHSTEMFTKTESLEKTKSRLIVSFSLHSFHPEFGTKCTRKPTVDAANIGVSKEQIHMGGERWFGCMHTSHLLSLFEPSQPGLL